MLWPRSVGYGLRLSKCSWVNNAWMFCSAVRLARVRVGSLKLRSINHLVQRYQTEYTKSKITQSKSVVVVVRPIGELYLLALMIVELSAY